MPRVYQRSADKLVSHIMAVLEAVSWSSESYGLRNQCLALIPVLSLSSCVTMDLLLNLFVTQFPLFQNGHINSPDLIGVAVQVS